MFKKNNIIYENIDFITIKYKNISDLNFLNWIKNNSDSINYDDFYNLKLFFFNSFEYLKIFFISSNLKNLIQIRKNINPKTPYANGYYFDFYWVVFSDIWIWFVWYFFNLFLKKDKINKKYIQFNRVDYCIDLIDFDINIFIKKFKPWKWKISTVARKNQDIWIYTNYFRYSTEEFEIVFYDKILDIIDKKKYNNFHYKKYLNYKTITRIEYREKARKLKNHNLDFNNIKIYMRNNLFRVLNKYLNLNKNKNWFYVKKHNTLIKNNKICTDFIIKEKYKFDKLMFNAYLSNLKDNSLWIKYLDKVYNDLGVFLFNNKINNEL